MGARTRAAALFDEAELELARPENEPVLQRFLCNMLDEFGSTR